MTIKGKKQSCLKVLIQVEEKKEIERCVSIIFHKACSYVIVYLGMFHTRSVLVINGGSKRLLSKERNPWSDMKALRVSMHSKRILK